MKVNWLRLLAQVSVFFFFFPYPAVTTLGNSIGLQMGQAIGIALTILSVGSLLKTSSFRVYFSLVGVALLSLAATTITGNGIEAESSFKATVSLALGLSFLPAAAIMVRRFGSAWLQTPISLALIVHGVVGLYQYAAFARGEFPLLFVFENPSFASLFDVATTYATYIRRPFGLFPEPSAMAACVVPWTLWLLKDSLQKAASNRLLHWLAILAASSLVALSKSNFLFFFFPAAIWLVLGSFRLHGPKLVLARMGGMSVAIAAALFASTQSDLYMRSTHGDGSLRMLSLLRALPLPLQDSVSLVFGVGPGQTVNILRDQISTGGAVYSLTLTAWAEGGVVALAAMAIVGIKLLRTSLWRSHPIAVVAWAIAVTLVTSYVVLAPIWLFLAVALDGVSETRDQGDLKASSIDGRNGEAVTGALGKDSPNARGSSPLLQSRARRPSARL